MGALQSENRKALELARKILTLKVGDNEKEHILAFIKSLNNPTQPRLHPECNGSTDPLFEIPGYPSYAVSRQGGVWSVKSKKFLKPWRETSGLRVELQTSRSDKNDRPRRPYVHQLVLWAFVGPTPFGLQPIHVNGDDSDNRLQNLKYGLQSEKRSKQRVLKTVDIEAIKALHSAGVTLSELAADYGVSQKTISKAIHGFYE